MKRLICTLLDHNWTRHRYPADRPGADRPGGSYLKCVRCGKVTESAGLPSGPMIGGV
jgi:hypothetical protein